MHKHILILHGNPGVGKTEIATKLAKLHHYALISQDYFLFQMNGVKDPEHGVTAEDYGLAIKNMLSCMKNFMETKQNIIIEGSLVSISQKDPENINDFISKAEIHGYTTIIIQLIASDEARKQRMKNRGYTVPEEIEALLCTASASLQNDNYTIDTSNKTADEVTSELFDLLTQS